MNYKGNYFRMFFLVLSITVLAMAGESALARENLEKQIDTIIDVLSSPDTENRDLQNKKNTIRNILHQSEYKSGEPLIDGLIRVYLGERDGQGDTQNNQNVLDEGVEQIIGIINPDASWEERQKQKKTIITILNGNFQKEPKQPNKTRNGRNSKNLKSENLSILAEVTVSNEIGYQFRGENAIDGVENTEWVASGAQGQWLLLKWQNPVDVETVLLQGRRQDQRTQIWSSDLIFSDGSIMGAGALNAAELRTIRVNKKNITWMKYLVRNGVNDVGLSEIVAKGVRKSGGTGKNVVLVPANLAQLATVSVSGYTKKHIGEKAIDRNPKTEWIADGKNNQWIFLQWNQMVTIDHIKLRGRKSTSGSRKNDGFLVFSNGIIKPLNGLDGRQIKDINCNFSEIFWVKYYIRKAQHNAGLAEIEVIGVMPKDNVVVSNLAQSAVVQVSDQQSGKFRSEYVNDRRLDTEWVAKGHRDKWVSLQWRRPVNVATITVTAGEGLENGRIEDAMVILSDGSLESVGGLAPGQPKTVEINRKGLRWVRFFIREGRGKIGLAEIEVKEQ